MSFSATLIYTALAFESLSMQQKHHGNSIILSHLPRGKLTLILGLTRYKGLINIFTEGLVLKSNWLR